MKNEESLAFATIEELSALLAKRKISPVELTELFLRRIDGVSLTTLAVRCALAAGLFERADDLPGRDADDVAG